MQSFLDMLHDRFSHLCRHDISNRSAQKVLGIMVIVGVGMAIKASIEAGLRQHEHRIGQCIQHHQHLVAVQVHVWVLRRQFLCLDNSRHLLRQRTTVDNKMGIECFGGVGIAELHTFRRQQLSTGRINNGV